MRNTPKERAQALLAQMSLEEKLYQLSGQMIFHVDETYENVRNPMHGNYRNPGHFMHHEREIPASAAEVAERINRDVRLSMEAQPHAIPPLEHGEALHGAQWGMATVFPQPLIDDLTLAYNKGRQQEITAEILDLIGGTMI